MKDRDDEIAQMTSRAREALADAVAVLAAVAARRTKGRAS